MPKLYGYCRASTFDQEVTLTVQAETIEKEYKHAYAAEYEFGGCFSDRGVSGSKELRSRPEGSKLSSTLEAGDAVIFTKLDRGFRSVRDLVETLAVWNRRKIRVILLDIRVDTGTPIGMMVATIFGAVAQFERARMVERMIESNEARRRKGLPVNQKCKYGFKLVGPKGKRHYAPDPYQRAIGAKILKWHLDGWTRTAIYLHLFKHRVMNEWGREWSEKGVRKAIEGEMRLQQEERAAQELEQNGAVAKNPLDTNGSA